MLQNKLTHELIEEAAAFLRERVRETPLERSGVLSRLMGVDVYLKLENLQITGSFKVRGALFALHSMRRNGIERIATCSAGNHGKGIAFAADQLGMQATIFVPRGVDEAKYSAMLRLGADVRVSSFVGYDDTERWALEQADAMDVPFVSAYDDPAVMAGNGGSVAVEVMGQLPQARTFVMPAGGGGHSAGFAFWVKDMHRGARIVLTQHRKCPAFQRSLERGYAVTEFPGFETLASGLEGGFGRNTFEILKSRVDHVSLVSEEEIAEAMRWMFSNHQYAIEGSSAAAIASCLKEDVGSVKEPVVVFISGRNVAMDTFARVLSGPAS